MGQNAHIWPKMPVCGQIWPFLVPFRPMPVGTWDTLCIKIPKPPYISSLKMVRFVHSSNFFYLAREILQFTVLLDHPVSCLYRLAIIIIIIITSIIIMNTGWPPRKVDPAFKLNISRSPLKRPPGLQLRSMRSFFIPGKIKNYPMMNIFFYSLHSFCL